jgi:hypothetical protein
VFRRAFFRHEEGTGKGDYAKLDSKYSADLGRGNPLEGMLHIAIKATIRCDLPSWHSLDLLLEQP